MRKEVYDNFRSVVRALGSIAMVDLRVENDESWGGCNIVASELEQGFWGTLYHYNKEFPK